VRKVRTASGAVAVQIVTRRGRLVEQVEHLGSAHTDAELTLLLAMAHERLTGGQDGLDLGGLPVQPPRMDEVADWTGQRRGRAGLAGQAGLDEQTPAVRRGRGRPPSIDAGTRVVATSALLLWRVLTDAYCRLGFDALADEAFRAMVLARIVEPTSKADSLRVLTEIGVPAPSLRIRRSRRTCASNCAESRQGHRRGECRPRLVGLV